MRSVLEHALAGAKRALMNAHAELSRPGSAVVDGAVRALRVTSNELLFDNIVADVRDQWTYSEADLRLLSTLLGPGRRVIEVGRLLGVGTLALLSTGADVVSVDANALADTTWPIDVDFGDAQVLRHQALFAAHADRLVLENALVARAAAELLANRPRLTLVDAWFAADRVDYADVLVEDIWSFSPADDPLIDSMLGLVDGGTVRCLAVHDVWRITHVRSRLTAMLAEHSGLAVTWPVTEDVGFALVYRGG